ncbi:MAG: histidine kinase [Flavobacterium sp.]
MNKTKMLFISILLCTNSFQFCLAQEPYAYTLNQNHGLKSLSIYDVFQDKNGFLWFATGKGLCRYDGTHFDYFTSKEQTLKSGSCIKEDLYGRIWYSNFDGFLFYVKNNQLTEFPVKNQSGFKNFAIIKNHLYIPQGDQIEIYDLQNFSLKKVIPLNGLIKFALQVGDEYYVLTNQLYQISSDFKTTSFSFPENTDTNFIAPILCYFQQKLWLVSKYDLKCYVFDKIKFTKIENKLPVDFIQNIGVDSNNIWLCSPKGMVKWQPQPNKAELFFPNTNITCVYVDKYENYWIGTQNQGILWIPNFENRLIPSPSTPINLQSDQEKIWIGTLNDALYHWDYQNNQFDLLSKSDINHAINQMLIDKENQKIIWNSSKLHVYDTQKKKKILEKVVAIKDLCKLDAKYYAFAASGYIGLLSLDGTKKSRWDESSYMQNASSNDFPAIIKTLMTNTNGKSIAKVSENLIYVATNVGLLKITPEKIEEITFQGKSLYLTNIKNLNNKLIALGTNDLLYEIQNDQVVLWEKANQWMENYTQKMVIKNDRIFISDQKNWWEFVFKNNKFIRVFATVGDIDVTDVLPFKEELIFATNKGLIRKKKDKNSSEIKPKLLIHEVQFDEVKKNPINKFSVPYQNEIINIHYSVVYFSPGNQPKLQYRINNGKWLNAPLQNKTISFASLAYGTYSVELMVPGYPKTKQTIQFEILKPWWLQTWFFVTSILLISLLVWLLHRVQIQKIQKENLRILEKVELEKNWNLSALKAIKSQMNPHFFYNALNTIQSYILSNDKKLALNYLSKFSNLTRTILEMSEKEWISIAEEIKTLTLYLEIEKGRFADDFYFSLTNHQIPDTETQKIPTMLLQPYVENAVKHGLLHKTGEKRLDITFSNQSPYLVVKIEDNGIGRNKSQELNQIKNKKHQSFATKAMENRIELLNKNYKTLPISVIFEDKTNDAGVSLGTIVWVHIPIFTD